MATTDITLMRARLMATMALTGSWAECSLAQAPGMVGDTVGAAAGGAVGVAAATTDVAVMATVAVVTLGVVTSDVAMPDEDMRVADIGLAAGSMVLPAVGSMALPAVASMVGPQVADSTVAAVVMAADTGNT